jgi:hypothetical protein
MPGRARRERSQQPQRLRQPEVGAEALADPPALLVDVVDHDLLAQAVTDDAEDTASVDLGHLLVELHEAEGCR